MFEALGFSRRKVAEEIASDPPREAERWRMRKWFDAHALNTLTDDIKRWAQQDRRFVAAIAPQIGHAPLLKRGRAGTKRNVHRFKEAGRVVEATTPSRSRLCLSLRPNLLPGLASISVLRY